jgi:nicotinate-nucleotide adenylyltransferase
LPNPEKTNKPSRGGVWGILGGTFNPVHMGHLIMAESVMHSVNADGMLFVPAKWHPFKSDRQISNYNERIEMLQVAIADNLRFLLEEPPADSGYTIDLIDCLRTKYPAAEFFLVVGSDILEEFDGWRRHEEIEQSVRIVIAGRPGHQLEGRDRNIISGAERIIIPQYDISSSDIRERIRSRMPIKYMVPETVERYIYEKKLYVG